LIDNNYTRFDLSSPKKYLVYGINYYPELTGIGKYTGEMVKWMVDNDCDCTVVTSYPYYPYWEVQKPYNSNFYKKEVFTDKRLTVYRCPLYIPQNPSGVKRILHDASFFMSTSLLFIRLLFKQRYDYVITVAPPFHIGLIAIFYRFFKCTRINYHIQDLQVDAAKELNMIRSRFLLSMMFKMEKWIIGRVDTVSSISDGMVAKIKNKVDKPVIMFPNWADVDSFKPLPKRKDLKTEWGFEKDDYVVLYSGNLGEKQGLGIIIDVAAETVSNLQIKYVICGAGAYKTTLFGLAQERALNNITFLPLQEYDVFNRFLNMADLHLVLQKGDASDLVMPSKLSTILAVGGLSLVTALPGTSLYDIISDNNIGLLAIPENVASIAATIKYSFEINNEDICLRARKYAEANLSIDNIMPQFLKNIE